MMRTCIMVRVGGSQKANKNEVRGEFINFAEIGGIFNMHHWCREGMGMDALDPEF